MRQISTIRWMPNDFPLKCYKTGLVSQKAWVGALSRGTLSDEGVLNIFAVKALANFFKHSPNKLVLLFFGPPENQQAKMP